MLKRSQLNRKVSRLHVVWAHRKSKNPQVLIDLNGEIDSSTIIGEVNTIFSITDRSLRQKINKKTAHANSTNGLYRLLPKSSRETPPSEHTGSALCQQNKSWHILEDWDTLSVLFTWVERSQSRKLKEHRQGGQRFKLSSELLNNTGKNLRQIWENNKETLWVSFRSY